MSINRIFILSRAEAATFDPRTATQKGNRAAIISICGRHEVPPTFKYGEHYFYKHYTQFDDITPASTWELDNGYKPMDMDQAEDIATAMRFWDRLEDLSTLVIHCAAGISRSAATALAIAEWKNLRNIVQEIHTSTRYFPNGHVLALLRRALGIDKASMNRADIETMYFQLFAGKLAPWNQEKQ